MVLRRIALLFVLAAGLRLPAAAAPGGLVVPEELFPELQTILRDAVKQSPAMISRSLDIELAEANRVQAAAVLKPRVEAFGQFNEQSETREGTKGTNVTQKTYYRVEANQVLYQWGAAQAQARLGELGVKIAQGQIDNAYRLLAQDLRARYLSLIIQKNGLSRARLNLAAAERQVGLAEEALKAGAITPGDLGGAKYGVDQARFALDHSEHDYTQARRTFARMAGLKEFPDERVPAEFPEVKTAPEAANSLLQSFLAQSEPSPYVLKSIRDQLQQEKLNLTIADARLKPKLNLVAGLSQDEVSYTADVGAKYGVQATYVGVQVQWAIFDGFATRGARAAVLARKRQLEQSYRATSEELAEQARDKAAQLGFSARTLAFAEGGLAGAISYLEFRRKELAIGQASRDDIVARENAVFDSRLTAYNARIDYLMRVVDFLGLVAEDPALVQLPARSP